MALKYTIIKTFPVSGQYVVFLLKQTPRGTFAIEDKFIRNPESVGYVIAKIPKELGTSVINEFVVGPFRDWS